MRHIPRSRIQLLLFAGAIALAGCRIGDPSVPLPVKGAQDGVSQTIPLIEGKVLDAQGQPVPGAAIRAYASRYRIEGISSQVDSAVTGTTDALGRFALKNPPLGSIAVEASTLGGLKALKLNVPVAQGAQVEVGTLTLKPTGSIRGRVHTADGGALLGTDVFIPGTDRAAKTDGEGNFTLDDVPEGTYPLAAMRQSYAPAVAQGIVVRPNEQAQAELTLRLDAPTLSSLSAPNGGPGSTLTLRGENFGASKHTILFVYFNSTLATTFERLSDSEIRVTVPDTVTSGNVVVVSGGVSSNPLPFTVISRIALAPEVVGVYPGSAHPFVATAYDEHGTRIASPVLSWASSYQGAGTLDQAGLFQADGEGTTQIQVKSGKITALANLTSSAYEMVTVAGNGAMSTWGDGLDARSGSFALPYGLAAFADGRLLVSEVAGSEVVRQIAPDGTLSTFAGGGALLGDDGPAHAAQLDDPTALAIDSLGGVAIADSMHHRIRYVSSRQQERFGIAMQPGRIYTIAGTGATGTPQDGASASESALSYPRALAFDDQDTLFFCSTQLNRVYRLAPDGRLWLTAGNGSGSSGSVPAVPTQLAMGSPTALAADDKGNLAIGTQYRVYFVCREAGTYFGRAMASGSAYPLIGAVGFGNGPDGTDLANLRLKWVRGLAFDAQGQLWLSDENHVIRRLSTDGKCVTIAGAPWKNGVGGAARSEVNAGQGHLNEPTSVIPRSEGRILFVDSRNNRLVELIPRPIAR